MELSNQDAERLAREAYTALQNGNAAAARAKFETLTETGRANGQIWMLLSLTCRALNDAAAEEAALDQLLKLEPRALRGHILKGDCRANAGDRTAALLCYATARRLADGQELPDDLVSELQRVSIAAEAIRSKIEAEREKALTKSGLSSENRSPRFQQSLDILAGRKQIFHQEPNGYYFPGLPPIQFFDTAEFDWVADIESATADIKAELEELLSEGTEDFRPYIQSETHAPRIDNNVLLDNADWSALFLSENGVLSKELLARCPKTWAAVQKAPFPRINLSPTVMFSLLKAGARITPHTGTHNTRLICHLPLIVPPKCSFRVGNEVREWEEGKLLIFDDTIEHEAWNDSDQDRVILIFDIWRPELSEREREEIGALYAVPQLK